MERESLATLIIAATTDAQMRYASGLRVTDPFILLDTGRERHILVSSLEYGRVKLQLAKKRGYRVVLFDRYYEAIKRAARRGVKVRRGSVLALIAAAYLKERRIRAVTMPRNAWAIHVEQLRKAGVRVTLAAGPLYPRRAVKTAAELREIRKVRDATIAALERCIRIIRASRIGNRKELSYQQTKLTSEFLRAEARKILLDYGCEASEMIISHGSQTAYPHDNGSGILRAGEPIILDFFPRSSASGYWFDMTRTVCKGEPSPSLKRQWDAVKAAQDACLQKVRAGVTTGTVHAAAVAVFTARGFVTSEEEGFIHGTGHGVGLEIHEAPSLGERGTEVLRAGMVITIEPGLYYRNIGGVRLENTVLVTKAGYNDLTRYPRVLRL